MADSPNTDLPGLAAVTTVHNDPDHLRIWADYHARQLGARNLYVIDLGSDDGSTADLGEINVLRLPRTKRDDVRRAAFISDFTASLLAWYECVLHSEVDEMLVADPRHAPSLAALAATTRAPVLNAIGVHIIHRLGQEMAFDPTRPVLHQRRHVFSASAACKPALIRRPARWAPGFHAADAPACFGHLWLFSLRWFDLDIAHRRLATTRAMAWQYPDAGRDQRLSDDEMTQQMVGFASLPQDTRDLDAGLPPVSDFVADVLRSQRGRETDVYRIALDIWPSTLWRIPERFRGLF